MAAWLACHTRSIRGLVRHVLNAYQQDTLPGRASLRLRRLRKDVQLMYDVGVVCLLYLRDLP